MKKSLIKLSVALMLLTGITGCDKWIDTDLNNNPDQISDVPFNQMLPTIEASLGYNLGGFSFRLIPGMWMQYVSGQARQAATIGRNYLLIGDDINDSWFLLYAHSLMDLKVYIDKTGVSNRQALGVGKILMALGLAHTTDLWGDIPYSEAFLGNDNLKPRYDSQESIYTVINTLLTEALDDLSTPDSENTIPFGSSSNDYIYNGDITRWISAAHSLRARYALRLSKKGNVDYSEVISDCEAGIKSNDDDLQMPFGDTESNANPTYQYDTQRGDVSPSPSFADRAAGDPRLAVFSDGTTFGAFYGSINSPVPLMTYVETKFIEAEARLRQTSPSQELANAAYDEAVTASLAKFGIDDPEWLSNNTSAVLGNRSIQDIIEAKYIALFLQTEPYNDYRRTGWPQLVPTAGESIPARFPYCRDETLYNTENVPTGISLDTPVWWAE